MYVSVWYAWARALTPPGETQIHVYVSYVCMFVCMCLVVSTDGTHINTYTHLFPRASPPALRIRILFFFTTFTHTHTHTKHIHTPVPPSFAACPAHPYSLPLSHQANSYQYPPSVQGGNFQYHSSEHTHIHTLTHTHTHTYTRTHKTHTHTCPPELRRLPCASVLSTSFPPDKFLPIPPLGAGG